MNESEKTMRPAELEDLLQKLESHRRELVHQVREMSEEEAGRRGIPTDGGAAR